MEKMQKYYSPKEHIDKVEKIIMNKDNTEKHIEYLLRVVDIMEDKLQYIMPEVKKYAKRFRSMIICQVWTFPILEN